MTIRILQERIESIAVGGNLSTNQTERMRREVHQQEEENLHGRDDGRSMRRELRIDFVA